MGQSAFASLPPELVLLILQYILYHIRPQMSSPPLFPPRSLYAHWMLRRLQLHTFVHCGILQAPRHFMNASPSIQRQQAQCILLKRTLQDVPSLQELIRFLHLPSAREGSISLPYNFSHCRATPASVVKLSADILALCRHVQGINVLQHASNIDTWNGFQSLTICRIIE